MDFLFYYPHWLKTNLTKQQALHAVVDARENVVTAGRSSSWSLLNRSSSIMYDRKPSFTW